MDNYINLAELRKAVESLLYKINTVADTKVNNTNIIINEANSSNFDEDNNYIIGTINENDLKVSYDWFKNNVMASLWLSLNNNTIQLYYNDNQISSVTLPVYNGGVSG